MGAWKHVSNLLSRQREGVTQEGVSPRIMTVLD